MRLTNSASGKIWIGGQHKGICGCCAAAEGWCDRVTVVRDLFRSVAKRRGAWHGPGLILAPASFFATLVYTACRHMICSFLGQRFINLSGEVYHRITLLNPSWIQGSGISNVMNRNLLADDTWASDQSAMDTSNGQIPIRKHCAIRQIFFLRAWIPIFWEFLEKDIDSMCSDPARRQGSVGYWWSIFEITNCYRIFKASMQCDMQLRLAQYWRAWNQLFP